MSWNDWLNLFLRWAHLIAGISWIGSSLYFIWLDGHLEAPSADKKDVEGELWMVHSGGFYQVERRRIEPGSMPRTLHWFRWEAMLTWMTGILLLSVVYYMTRGVYLVDPAVSSITPGRAALLGLGVIVAAWFVYDLLWSSAISRLPALATGISFALAAGMTYGFCRVLSGRAAFIHVGAVFGTLMVANVWLRILPAQQKMVDATREGRTPDFALSDLAKTRSVHNSYMTFPVLFIMLSNHFPGTYASPLNWLVLGLLIVLGACVRHLMIGKGGRRYWALAAMVPALVAMVLLTAPASMRAATGMNRADSGPAPAFAQVRAVVLSRCVPCHSAHPRETAFGAAPAGVSFDDPANIKRLAERIEVRAVETKTMPLGNKTGITEEEREVLRRWIAHGAPTD